MPLKKNYRKKQKTYKPRKPRKSKKQVIPLGIPEKHIARLRYFENITINAASVGGVASYSLRANSCFDPNITGAGHQPRYYDQWSALYKKCTVIGSKITIIPTSDTNNTYDFICGAQLDTDFSISTDPRDYMEARRVGRVVLSPATAPTQKAIALKFDLKKMSKSSRPLSDDNLSHTTSTNPNEQWYYNLFLFNPGAVTSPATTFQFNVTIDYICMFTDAVLPGLS